MPSVLVLRADANATSASIAAEAVAMLQQHVAQSYPEQTSLTTIGRRILFLVGGPMQLRVLIGSPKDPGLIPSLASAVLPEEEGSLSCTGVDEVNVAFVVQPLSLSTGKGGEKLLDVLLDGATSINAMMDPHGAVHQAAMRSCRSRRDAYTVLDDGMELLSRLHSEVLVSVLPAEFDNKTNGQVGSLDNRSRVAKEGTDLPRCLAYVIRLQQQRGRASRGMRVEEEDKRKSTSAVSRDSTTEFSVVGFSGVISADCAVYSTLNAVTEGQSSCFVLVIWAGEATPDEEAWLLQLRGCSVDPLPLQVVLDDASDGLPLPPGWELKYTDDGRPYYVDHIHCLTTWDDPRETAESGMATPSRWTVVKSQPTPPVEYTEEQCKEPKVGIVVEFPDGQKAIAIRGSHLSASFEDRDDAVELPITRQTREEADSLVQSIEAQREVLQKVLDPPALVSNAALEAYRGVQSQHETSDLDSLLEELEELLKRRVEAEQLLRMQHGEIESLKRQLAHAQRREEVCSRAVGPEASCHALQPDATTMVRQLRRRVDRLEMQLQQQRTPNGKDERMNGGLSLLMAECSPTPTSSAALLLEVRHVAERMGISCTFSATNASVSEAIEEIIETRVNAETAALRRRLGDKHRKMLSSLCTKQQQLIQSMYEEFEQRLEKQRSAEKSHCLSHSVPKDDARRLRAATARSHSDRIRSDLCSPQRRSPSHTRRNVKPWMSYVPQ